METRGFSVKALAANVLAVLMAAVVIAITAYSLMDLFLVMFSHADMGAENVYLTLRDAWFGNCIATVIAVLALVICNARGAIKSDIVGNSAVMGLLAWCVFSVAAAVGAFAAGRWGIGLLLLWLLCVVGFSLVLFLGYYARTLREREVVTPVAE